MHMASELDSPLSDPVAVLRLHGEDDYIGEPITQLAHALQCAALAERAGGSDALVAAALFHDIGHLCAPQDAPVMPGLGVVEHEHVGAALLARAGYPAEVCELVRGHVEAKRFLVATKPDYARNLSPASVQTLALQGGPMLEAEVAAFRVDPLYRDKLRLRTFDERAKEPDWQVPGLTHYQPLLGRLRRCEAQRRQRDGAPAGPMETDR